MYDLFLDGGYLFGRYFYVEIIMSYYYCICFFNDCFEVLNGGWFFEFGYDVSMFLDDGFDFMDVFRVLYE